MFDRLKTENETRKHEIHGLKDILVRENDNRIQETEELRMAMELGKDLYRYHFFSLLNKRKIQSLLRLEVFPVMLMRVLMSKMLLIYSYAK